jgi:peptidyl-prolyl cis-trans isomerase SurA
MRAPAHPSSYPQYRLLILVAFFAIPWTVNSRSLGQGTEPRIAAKVGNQIISVEQVDKLLAQTLDDRPLSDEVKTMMRAKALDQLVGQSLVIEYFRAQGNLASDDDVRLALERLQEELKSVEQTLDQYLVEQGLTRESLMNQFRFRLSWMAYLQSSLTDENLQKHFNRFRRELDGGQIRVSQLLLKVGANDPQQWESTRQQAEQIREQIIKGELEWSAAVQEKSQAASRDTGGDLGWIGRWAPMPESFSQAAFALEPGKISPPIRTEFGIHLIRCEQVEPGTENWQTVEPAVRKHATQYLFEWIVTRQKPLTSPEFTGLSPYLDPATGNVIAATSPTPTTPR